jgi:hypothetical protein
VVFESPGRDRKAEGKPDGRIAQPLMSVFKRRWRFEYIQQVSGVLVGICRAGVSRWHAGSEVRFLNRRLFWIPNQSSGRSVLVMIRWYRQKPFENDERSSQKRMHPFFSGLTRLSDSSKFFN